MYAIVARELGKIIATSPVDHHDELINAAATMLADTTSDSPDRYLELANTSTQEAAESWTSQPIRERLRSPAVTLSAIHHPPSDPSSEARVPDQSSTAERHRREEHSRGLDRDDTNPER